MKKLAILTSVLAFALGFAASEAAAHHGKGSHTGVGSGAFQSTNEGPMLTDVNGDCTDANGNGICDSSIAKVGSGGAYKVDIRGVTAAAGPWFQLCFVFGAAAPGDTTVFVDEVELLADGDLNFTGNLINDGTVPVISLGDRLEAPYFQVLGSAGEAGDCDEATMFIQGLILPTP